MGTRKDDESEALQRLIDAQFRTERQIDKIGFLVAAESMELCEDLLEICRLLPPGVYTRSRLCDQLNSSIVGHGWNQRFGTYD